MKQISKFSVKDAENFEKYTELLDEIVDFINPIIDTAPAETKWELLKLMYKLKWPKKQGLSEMYQLLTAPASTVLNQWFESDILKGTLASDAVIGAMQSPFTPGSSYVLLHHVMGEIMEKGIWCYVKGGMGAVSGYLAKIATERGVDIVTNAHVDQIIVEGNIAKGIVVNGHRIEGGTVITNCTDHVTFSKLLPNSASHVEENYLRGLKNIDFEGCQTKFNLIVNDLPQFKCLSNVASQSDSFEERKAKLKHYLQGTVHIGSSSMEEIHEAYAYAANKEFSRNPMVEMTIPSLLDDSLTPHNSKKYVVNLFVQYSPYKLKNKKWEKDTKEEFKKCVFDAIDNYAPGFSNTVEFCDMLTPPDLEEIFGLTNGNLFHGAMTLNALYAARPAPGYNSYKTPIKGLYRCGASAHPGGGVMGAPGRNSALTILKDRK